MQDIFKVCLILHTNKLPGLHNNLLWPTCCATCHCRQLVAIQLRAVTTQCSDISLQDNSLQRQLVAATTGCHDEPSQWSVPFLFRTTLSPPINWPATTQSSESTAKVLITIFNFRNAKNLYVANWRYPYCLWNMHNRVHDVLDQMNKFVEAYM